MKKTFWIFNIFLLIAATYGSFELLDHFTSQPAPTDSAAYRQYHLNIETAATVFGIFGLSLMGLTAYGLTKLIIKFFSR